jgi:hypothetical protein
MGWVEMSERELRRAEVLASVFAGRLTMTAAADPMGVTRRQAHRLARLFEAEGAPHAFLSEWNRARCLA